MGGVKLLSPHDEMAGEVTPCTKTDTLFQIHHINRDQEKDERWAGFGEFAVSEPALKRLCSIVGLWAGLRKNYATNFHKSLTEDGFLPRIDPIHFSYRLRNFFSLSLTSQDIVCFCLFFLHLCQFLAGSYCHWNKFLNSAVGNGCVSIMCSEYTIKSVNFLLFYLQTPENVTSSTRFSAIRKEMLTKWQHGLIMLYVSYSFSVVVGCYAQ